MSSPSQSAHPRRLGWSLALLAFGQLITSLDFTIVYVALPDIQREAGFSSHSVQWVISAYAIVWGGFLLLGGRSADLLGRRRMFVLGMALYGVSSLLGGLAPSSELLVTARAIQGLGAAVLFPTVLALVNTMFAEGPARNRALTWWAMAGAGGLGLGSLLGGVLTSALGWEAVFLVNVPLVVVGAAAAFVLLPPDAPRQSSSRVSKDFDLPGALTGTAGVTLLVFAIAQGPEEGWTSTLVVGAAVLAAVLLAAFLVIEGRSRSPLMPLRLVRSRSLSSALVVILIFAMSWQVLAFFLTLYFQDVLGYTALEGGLGFLGFSLAIAAGDLGADRLIHRAGIRATLIAGMLIAAAGSGLLGLGMTADGSYLTVLAGILVAGIAGGILFPAMFAAAATGVADREQGTAGGIASTAQQVGVGAGLAILVGIATADTGGLTGEALRVATSDGLQTAMYVAAAGPLLGALAALALPRARSTPDTPDTPEPTPDTDRETPVPT